ncbi:glutamine amidotransferase [Mameliella sediminis]|uniref:glutamine amidotransferase n=1 Tax=Mameliella sediminis TaxID=2836866 RepID=UPI001C4865BC|nr:glutamine amidotransferase [Mameliella sediminis]MBV7397001.1 glutamine amidotransferase [Mameliella sediminis]MBY6161869.1 glutamine amidotransferase [Mameliella alba]MBY6170339.1 glutamine amidotransferase [Mameliella alba]MBY6175358.1 glutamine amidotransferase [Mameliella alba]
MSRFLLLQLRPETEASDSEFRAVLDKSGLDASRLHRMRLDREDLPRDLDPGDYAGVIVGGGPGCVSDKPAEKDPVERRIEEAILRLMPRITAEDIPFMGCCYGIGILAHHLGAEVSKTRFGEPVGAVTCYMTDEGEKDPLTAGLPRSFDAFVGHKEAVQHLPKGAVHLVSSGPCPYQMIRYGQNVYATQFHPEADAAEFETRIHIYRHRGYFAPEEADTLIQMCRAADVTEPARILEGFVERYG